MLLVNQMNGFGVWPVVSAAPGLTNTKSLSCHDTHSYQRTQGAGASRRKMTFSFFVKTSADFNGGDVFIISSNGGGDVLELTTGSLALILAGFSGVYTSTITNSFADSTWYHILVQVDTSQAVSTNRVLAWVNGVSHSLDEGVAIPQNTDLGWGQNGVVDELFNAQSGIWLVDEYARIDNGILPASSFATTVPKPIDLSGLTFGTQGVWIRFETGAAATGGTDSSGNGRTYTNSGFVNGDFSTTVP